jgi:hypothetical protein
MRVVAIKKGQAREKATGFQEMGTVRCDDCGEEFFIAHHPASADRWVAEKQARWLQRVLAEEHKRDKKHPDRDRIAGLTASKAGSLSLFVLYRPLRRLP